MLVNGVCKVKVNNNDIMINQRKLILNFQKKINKESCISFYKKTKQPTNMLRVSERPFLAQYARIILKRKSRLFSLQQVLPA